MRRRHPDVDDGEVRPEPFDEIQEPRRVAGLAALDRPDRDVPVLDGEKTIEVRDRVPQERTYFAWHTPAYFEPGDAELDLASTILTDGLSARLNKTLVYDRQLAS